MRTVWFLHLSGTEAAKIVSRLCGKAAFFAWHPDGILEICPIPEQEEWLLAYLSGRE